MGPETGQGGFRVEEEGATGAGRGDGVRPGPGLGASCVEGPPTRDTKGGAKAARPHRPHLDVTFVFGFSSAASGNHWDVQVTDPRRTAGKLGDSGRGSHGPELVLSSVTGSFTTRISSAGLCPLSGEGYGAPCAPRLPLLEENRDSQCLSSSP